MERRNARNILIALGFYFLIQILVRVLVSPNLELDEAEQLILTQQLSLGYGSQPPLYTWILSGLFTLFGVSVFSLALLKNLLLFGTYLATYFAARELSCRRDVSADVMLSLLLLPQIVWESQRDLTHSVLVTTVTAVSILVWLRLVRKPSTGWYLLAGLCWGLGFLSKYNYGIFLLALVLATATLPAWRRRLADRRILLSLAVMAAVLAPHLLWMRGNMVVTFAQSGKFKQALHVGYLQAVTTGAASLVKAVFAFSLPLLLLYGFLWYRSRQTAATAIVNVAPSRTLLLRTIGISFFVCFGMVFLFRVTVFKDRWMQPILFFLPLALVPWMEPVFLSAGGRIIRWFTSMVAVMVLIIMAFRPWLVAHAGSTSRFNLPYSALATQLLPQLIQADLVVAQNRLLGGNLRLVCPQIKVAVPEAPLFHEERPHTLLAVWEKVSPDSATPYGKLVSQLTSSERVVVGQGRVQAPLRFAPQSLMELHWRDYAGTHR